METEIIAYKNNEKFALYKIGQLIDSDFSRKPPKSCVFISSTSNKPLSTGILAVSAPLALLSVIFGPSAPIPANIPVYSTQSPNTRIASRAYMQLSSLQLIYIFQTQDIHL